MKYLLFHGRHILHTKFQEEELRRLVGVFIEEGSSMEVVFAVTSANHANSRYNPVPFHYRVIGIDRFARDILAPYGVSWKIVPVPHMPPTEKFAERVLSYANATYPDLFAITPANTLVLCSTPSLLPQFRKAGFSVTTGEYDESSTSFHSVTPQALLLEYGKVATKWKDLCAPLLSQATRELWSVYEEIPVDIERLWNESILSEHGDITETRDYSTYSFSMSRVEVIDRKYDEIKSAIQPGVIVDEGCADGALLTRIAKDFPDADLIGVEITREFIAEAHERQRRGEFGNAFIFFYQRNLGKKIFEANTIDTTICNSTTHEIWSYGGGDETLRCYLVHKYDQLKPDGALVIRDVIGPEDGEGIIYAWLNDTDGHTPSPTEAVTFSASELSTRGRFYKFAHEFFNGKGVRYEEEEIKGRRLIKASRKDIADFLSKKNYVDNWESELHESFTHWSFSRWKKELASVGFRLAEEFSRAYTNEWIVENRLKGSAELYTKTAAGLIPEPFPPTNVLLLAHK